MSANDHTDSVQPLAARHRRRHEGKPTTDTSQDDEGHAPNVSGQARKLFRTTLKIFR